MISNKVTTYNNGVVTYSFKVKIYKPDNVVIFESILALIPDSENSSEFSCFYNFGKTENGTIKLVDVNCAG